MAGQSARPEGTLHPNIAPYGEVFACADGERIILAAGSDRQFALLCAVLGLEGLAGDPRFARNTARVARRQELAALLAPAAAALPRAELLRRLELAGVPAGAVNTVDQALGTEVARRMVLEAVMDGVPTARVRGNAFRIDYF